MAESESYAGLKMLVDTSFASRFLIASDAKILFANPAAEALFGYSADELTGKPIDVIFSAASDRKLALPPLDSPVRMITGDDQEIKGRTKDGSELILRVGTSPFRTLTGTFLAVTVFDITKCKQIEEELRARASSPEAVNQKISQDLQEPLRKIAYFSPLIERALVGGDRQTAELASQVVSHSASRALALVAGTLDYHLTPFATPKLESIEVRKEVEQALHDISAPIHESGATIRNFVPEKLKVKADRLQFIRLISNLITNSITFHKLGKSPDITVSASEDAQKGVQLSVKDKGIGFEPKRAENIFEPFATLQSFPQLRGEDIGLAAVQSICERHGWTIKAESLPGQGATFKVDMPIRSMGP